MLETKKDLSFFKLKSTAKITVLTAYDYNTAVALEKAGLDLILVGDSLAMVALGYPDTTQVTPEEMFSFTRAVKRGAPNSMIIGDLPLLSFKKTVDEAIADCKEFINIGASLVKLEGAEDKALEIFTKLKEQGIPSMGHIGYTPQSPEKFIKSKLVKDEAKLIAEAKALEAVGVKAMVLEMIPADIAQRVSAAVGVPTIGIGAGLHCDGQVLVTDDLLGKFPDFVPKFVRKYANQHEDSVKAFTNYINDVKSEQFP